MKPDAVFDHEDNVHEKPLAGGTPDNTETIEQTMDRLKKSFGHASKIIDSLFPNGITLKGDFQFQRFSLIIYRAALLGEYCQEFSNPSKTILPYDSHVSALLRNLDTTGPDVPF